MRVVVDTNVVVSAILRDRLPERIAAPRHQFMRPNIVGDDVRSLIIPRQIGNQRLLTSSPTAS